MYYNGDLNYNGHYSSEYGLIITEVPQITHSEIQGNTYDVPNRDGLLYDANTKRGMASIKVRFALKNHDYRYQLRQIRSWLSGRGRLTISDAPDSFYEVKRINLSESQLIVTLGYIEAEFIIEPYEYLWAYAKSKEAVEMTIAGATSYACEFKNVPDIAYPKIEIGTGNYVGLLIGKIEHDGYHPKVSILFDKITGTAVLDAKRKICYDKGTGELIQFSFSQGGWDDLVLDSGNWLIEFQAPNSRVTLNGGYVI